MPNMTFRDADAADIPAIVALVQSGYRGEASRAGWTTEADVLDGQRIDALGVREAIEQPHSVVLLAEDADNLVACAHVARLEGAGYFGMFAVQPGLQAGGIGSRVLGEAERLVQVRWHCSEMRMTVIDVREELIAWYERRGYIRTGQHKPFPYGDERFGIPKRDDLRFEWLVKKLEGDKAA